MVDNYADGMATISSMRNITNGCSYELASLKQKHRSLGCEDMLHRSLRQAGGVILQEGRSAALGKPMDMTFHDILIYSRH